MKKVHPLRTILPKLLAVATGAPRYLPEIKWSENLWTHNIFRAYEWLFYRRTGIRPEATVIAVDGMEYHYVHTLEAAIARLETMARSAIAREWVPPIRVYVPLLQTPVGIPVPASPYLFAIALGSATSEADTSTTSFSATSPSVSGSDTRGIAAIFGVRCTAIATPTWNGSSMTIMGSVRAAEAGARLLGLWTILAPTAGATTVATTITPNAFTPRHVMGVMTFYTGCLQDAIDASDGSTAGATGSISDTVTTIADNCWVVGAAGGSGVSGTMSAGSGVTLRGSALSVDSGDSAMSYGDSNGPKTPAGGYSMTFNSVGSGANLAIAMASFAPSGGTEYEQAVTANLAITASMLTPKTILQAITGTTAVTGDTLIGAIGKVLAGTAAMSASVLKQMAVELSATAEVTASTLAQRVYLVAMNAITAVTASTETAIAKVLEVTTAVTGSIEKTKSLLLSLTATTEVTGAITAVRELVLTATTAVTASVTTVLGKTLTAVATITAKVSAPFWRRKYPAHNDGDDYEVKYPHD